MCRPARSVGFRHERRGGLSVARQPADISDLEAFYRSHVQAFNDTKSTSANGLTSERLLASASVTVDEIVSRLATTFAQFISAITDVRQPV